MCGYVEYNGCMEAEGEGLFLSHQAVPMIIGIIIGFVSFLPKFSSTNLTHEHI